MKFSVDSNSKSCFLILRNNSGNCLMSQYYPWILQRLACCDTYKNKNQSWVTGDSVCVSNILLPECYGGVFCFHSCSPPSLWWCSFGTLLNSESSFYIFTIRQCAVICLQLACLLEWGQTFVFHVVCREFELERPKSVIICQHGIDRRFCDSKVTFHPS